MKYVVTVNGHALEVSVEGDRVSVDGIPHQAELQAVSGTPIRLLLLDDERWSFPMESTGRGAWTVLIHGERQDVEVLDERAAHLRTLVGRGVAPAGPPVLKAPMPGLVLRVLAQPGQKVVEGTSLIVLEAMKMENELKAVGSAEVDQVKVSPGQTVMKGEVLITFHG